MLQTRNAKRPPGGQLRSRPRDGRAVPMPPRPRSRDSKTGTASSGEQRHGVLYNVPLLAVFPVQGMGIPRPEMRLFGVRIILSESGWESTSAGRVLHPPLSGLNAGHKRPFVKVPPAHPAPQNPHPHPLRGREEHSYRGRESATPDEFAKIAVTSCPLPYVFLVAAP